MQALWPIPVSLVTRHLINIPAWVNSQCREWSFIDSHLMRHYDSDIALLMLTRKSQFDTLSAVSSESCHCLSLGRIVIIPFFCHDDVTMSHSLVTSITCGHQTPSSCRHWARMSSHPPVCEAQHVTLCQQGWSENYPWWWEHRAVISDHGNNVNYADDWDALEPG